LIPRLANVDIWSGRNIGERVSGIQLVVKKSKAWAGRAPKGVVDGVIILIMIFIVVAGNSEFRMACT